MSRLVVVGAGGHGRVVADAAAAAGHWGMLCFADDRWPALAETGTWAVTGTPQQLLDRPADGDAAVVAIGASSVRREWSERLERAGYALARVIHPSAVVSPSARLGAGSVLCAGAVLNPDCRVGVAVIVNTRAVVEHDCVVGDAVHLCPGVQIAGGVTIGDGAWIGIGATIVQGVRIGARATIGAGAVVIADVPDDCTVAGVPAKQLKHK